MGSRAKEVEKRDKTVSAEGVEDSRESMPRPLPGFSITRERSRIRNAASNPLGVRQLPSHTMPLHTSMSCIEPPHAGRGLSTRTENAHCTIQSMRLLPLAERLVTPFAAAAPLDGGAYMPAVIGIESGRKDMPPRNESALI